MDIYLFFYLLLLRNEHVFISYTDNTDLQGFVVGRLRVISEVIFCVESESELRIELSRQKIFEVMYTKNDFFGYF